MNPRKHILPGALPRAAATLMAAGAVAAATALALLAERPGSVARAATAHAARAATARATAYVRDDGGGNPTGFVSAEGDGSRSGPRTAARASTVGGKGSAAATARVEQVALLGGRVTADLASVKATASGSGAATSGRLNNLVVDSASKGDQRARAVYEVAGYGRLVVLDSSSHAIVGLKLKLSRQYASYPAGTTLRIAFASATATDATATPQPQPSNPKPAKPSKPNRVPSSTKPKRTSKKPARREPSRTHVLLTGKGFVFPVYGAHSFTDDWGAPRADTGHHEGNDIFATAGTPAVAVCAGSLNRVGTLPISGNRLWVKCKTGDSFFYAHLSAFATDARDGQQVKAGQVVGFVGSTGDAEKTPPHLHFEVHPGDGAAVDPYPFLRAWESHRDVPAAAWVRRNGQAGEQPGTLVVLKDFLSR